MSKQQKKPYHHHNLRRQFIDTTVEFLKEGQISELSMRAIAKKIDVSHNAIYRHFSDKNALLSVVADEGFTMLKNILQKEVDKYPDQPLEQLQNTGMAYVQFALKNPSYYRLMFGDYRTNPTQKNPSLPQDTEQMSSLSFEQLIQGMQSQETGLNMKREAFMVLVNIIIRCQQSGLITTDDPLTKALACWSLVHGLSMFFLDGQFLINEEQLVTSLSSLIVQLLIEGLQDKSKI
jgi:AcrR family transcriptional regulator